MSTNAPSFENYLLPTLSVSNGKAAVAFYKKAFDAVELTCISDPDGKLVAEMAVGKARFVVADESPEHGNIGADKLTGVSVRIGLMVNDPDAMAGKAVQAGAKVVYPVADQDYGYRLGHFIDPFGHHWEIGKPIVP